ncbi:MAG: hypothetical protein ACW99G_03460 [Candidatus Thorarchaeota archaeon]|jgi:hypothetical protein
MSIKQHILDTIKEDREKLSKKIAQIDEIETNINDYVYKVELHSRWEDYGEKNITESDPYLAEAIKKARNKFMLVNNRSDVQAHPRVWAVFPNEFKLFLPDKFWENLWHEIEEEQK